MAELTRWQCDRPISFRRSLEKTASICIAPSLVSDLSVAVSYDLKESGETSIG
jgi:hypothetical protein